MAEDIRTFSTDECQQSLNFDIFTNPHKLIPYPDSVAETVVGGSADKYSLGNVDVAGTLIAVGYKDKSTGHYEAQYMHKSALIDTWTIGTDGSGSAGEQYIQGSLIVYKGKPYNICVIVSGMQYTLQKLNPATTLTNVAHVTASGATYPAVKPVIHPEDNTLYFAAGYRLATWNDSAPTHLDNSVTVDKDIVAMCPYGTYLAVGVTPATGFYGDSNIYLWGRDTTLETFQGYIPCGQGRIRHLSVLNNNLIIIQDNTSYGNAVNNQKLIVKVYSGGAVEELKSISISSLTANFYVDETVRKDKLYFVGTETSAIYCVGKNKEGQYVVTQDRYMYNGADISVFNGLDIIGDTLWTGFDDTTSKLYRSKVATDTLTYASTSKYITTINPGMAIADRGKMKQLTAVRIYYTGKTNGTIGVKYAVDTATMISVISETTTAIEDIKQATMLADGTAFQAGREIQFQLESTGGVEIKGYEYDYDILNQ